MELFYKNDKKLSELRCIQEVKSTYGIIEKLAVSRSQVTFKHDKIDERALVHTIEKFF